MVKVAGKEALDAMVQEGRYHEDVFGINIADHKAARQQAAQLEAIKSLAAQSLAAITSALDKGLDVNAGGQASPEHELWLLMFLHRGCDEWLGSALVAQHMAGPRAIAVGITARTCPYTAMHGDRTLGVCRCCESWPAGYECHA